MIFSKKKKQNKWYILIEEWIKKLESGELAGLRIAYCAFAMEEAGLITYAGKTIRQQMSQMSRTQIVRLCERFRTFTSLEWEIDWAGVSLEPVEKVLPEETYRYVLILGSFHPNGYFREKCMYAMAGYDGMLFWLFPRVNDWVRQIRMGACKILEEYLVNCDGMEVIAGLPAFERLTDCCRRTESQMYELSRYMENRLSLILAEMDLKEIPSLEPSVRTSLYRIAVQTKAWNLQEMEFCLNQEKIPSLKKILLKSIFENPDCTLEWARHYLTDTSAQVRRMAVEFWYMHLKNCWPGLEEMLLDSNRGIREYAAYILNRHGKMDIREYYLGHLKDDAPEYAILGLSEVSSHGNIHEFLECMKRPERRIVKCALLALGSQEDFKDEELLWKYLMDDRIDISKAAYRSIRKKGFHMGAVRIFRAYTDAQAEHQKRYLLNLLLKENSWERLPYLLRLYREDMPEQKKNQVCLGIRCRSMYGNVKKPRYEEILSALDDCQGSLPSWMEKEIIYDMKFLYCGN